MKNLGDFVVVIIVAIILSILVSYSEKENEVSPPRLNTHCIGGVEYYTEYRAITVKFTEEGEVSLCTGVRR